MIPQNMIYPWQQLPAKRDLYRVAAQEWISKRFPFQRTGNCSRFQLIAVLFVWELFSEPATGYLPLEMKEALSIHWAYLSGWVHVCDRIHHEIIYLPGISFACQCWNTVHAISPPNFAGMETTLNIITQFLFHRLPYIKHPRSVLGLCQSQSAPYNESVCHGKWKQPRRTNSAKWDIR